MCPICVINPTQGHQSRFVSLADHIAREHDDENLSIFQTQRSEDKKVKDWFDIRKWILGFDS